MHVTDMSPLYAQIYKRQYNKILQCTSKEFAIYENTMYIYMQTVMRYFVSKLFTFMDKVKLELSTFKKYI